jgi:hypothetical protein
MTIDYKSLLHRYIHHVGREEGATFIPWIVCDSDWFTEAEIAELSAMDSERPKPINPPPD